MPAKRITVARLGRNGSAAAGTPARDDDANPTTNQIANALTATDQTRILGAAAPAWDSNSNSAHHFGKKHCRCKTMPDRRRLRIFPQAIEFPAAVVDLLPWLLLALWALRPNAPYICPTYKDDSHHYGNASLVRACCKSPREGRSQKAETRKKAEVRNPKWMWVGLSFGLRVSVVGIRPSGLAVGFWH
jgi:hypothetical protein